MVRRSWMIAVAAATLAAGAARSQAQDARRSKEGAALVVDGQVQGVYRAARPGRAEVVVQIRVEAAGTPGAPIDDPRRPSNGPRPPVRDGDLVYAHVLQEVGGDGGPSTVPSEGSWIRAHLSPRDGGGWRGASPDWFEPRTAPNGPQERPGEPGPAPPSGKTILKALGVKADPVEANGRLVLKVVEVLPGTPMQEAGFEKGDVVIGVNGSSFSSLQRLADLLAEGPPQAEFAVLNVRNQEQAAARVDVSGLFRGNDARRPGPSPPDAAPTPPRRSLGAELEPSRQGRRAGLRVTAVHPNSPAQKAGFEVGDVLVEAAGSPLPDEASLRRAVDRAGATLAVVVLDNRTGREVPVEVPLGEPKPGPEPSPAPAPAPDSSPTPAPGPGGGPSSRAIGLTVKPGTADLLPVVKVAAVAPGSPAAKAGVEAGDAIVGVNDRVVFAPDLFEEALKDAGRSFTLTVLDVKTGRKTPMKVDMGR